MKLHEAQWLESASKPQPPVPSAFPKTVEVALFMSWGTKKKMDLWNSAVVGREIIIYLTSENESFHLGLVVLTLMSQCSFDVKPSVL